MRRRIAVGPSNYEQDLQIFAPFDLDLDNMVDDQWSGYFFEYNKLFWAYTGERTTVGSKNVFENGRRRAGPMASSRKLFTDTNPQDEGLPPAPYVVTNGFRTCRQELVLPWVIATNSATKTRATAG